MTQDKLNLKELQAKLEVSSVQLKKLKLDNHRKQIAATRLLVQRNSLKFLNTKITQALFDVLKRIKCRNTNDKANIFEVINAIVERVEEAWGKYDVVFAENKELIQELNSKNEEIAFLTETLNNANLSNSKISTPKKQYYAYINKDEEKPEEICWDDNLNSPFPEFFPKEELTKKKRYFPTKINFPTKIKQDKKNG